MSWSRGNEGVPLLTKRPEGASVGLRRAARDAELRLIAGGRAIDSATGHYVTNVVVIYPA